MSSLIKAAFHSLHLSINKGGTCMKILFINNDGGGFADHTDVADGTRATA